MGINPQKRSLVGYNVYMNEYTTVDYEDRYYTLLKVYKDEVLIHEDAKQRFLGQLRHYMIANAQLSKELDDARELIDTLLIVDKAK